MNTLLAVHYPGCSLHPRHLLHLHKQILFLCSIKKNFLTMRKTLRLHYILEHFKVTPPFSQITSFSIDDTTPNTSTFIQIDPILPPPIFQNPPLTALTPELLKSISHFRSRDYIIPNISRQDFEVWQVQYLEMIDSLRRENPYIGYTHGFSARQHLLYNACHPRIMMRARDLLCRKQFLG